VHAYFYSISILITNLKVLFDITLIVVLIQPQLFTQKTQRGYFVCY